VPAPATPPPPAARSATRLEAGHEVLLQGFNWDSHNAHSGRSLYRRLSERVAEIAALGCSAVWLPPCSQSLAPQGYMPQRLYCLDSAYGSEQELRALLAELAEARLLALADVVLNHRCAVRRGREGRWNVFEGGGAPGQACWDASAITRNGAEWAGAGNWGTGEEWEGAPNIDHTQAHVRADLRSLLRWLREDVGFSGLRLDFCKGYSARFAAEYSRAFAGEWSVGEFWQTMVYEDGRLAYDQRAHAQQIVNWLDACGGECTAFDFTTKGVLQEACARGEWWRLRDSAGKPPGVIGLWPSRAVTFIDVRGCITTRSGCAHSTLQNHDTGSSQQHWPFPSHCVAMGYAYILTSPGTPCVFWDHAFEWGSDVRDAVRRCIAARRASGINSRSPVDILQADSGGYAAVTGGVLALRLGGGDWSPQPGKDWSHVAGGDGYCVWLRNAGMK